MVLSDADLLEALERGEVGIEPFDEKNLTPNGYDLVAESILIPKFKVEADRGAVPIPPLTWFVVSTRETVKLGRRVSGQLWLRSGYARQGVLATFGKVDAGFEGTLTINAFNSSNVTIEIPTGERFCQLVLERLESAAVRSYPERTGRFQGQKGITLTPRPHEVSQAKGEGDTGREGHEAQADGTHAGDGSALKEEPREASQTKKRGASAGVQKGRANPTQGEQPCRRLGCVHCCLHTEMPLTNDDVKRLAGLGFDPTFFSENVDGWLQLKNTSEGRCFFLEDKLCSVYHYRPEGCTLYPIVFETDSGDAILDHECPHAEEFLVPNELRRLVSQLVDKLRRERRDRKYRKVHIDL